MRKGQSIREEIFPFLRCPLAASLIGRAGEKSHFRVKVLRTDGLLRMFQLYKIKEHLLRL